MPDIATTAMATTRRQLADSALQSASVFIMNAAAALIVGDLHT